MNDKLPPQIADLIAPLWVWLLALIGATVGFFEDMRPDDTHSVKFFKFVAKCSSSALAALLTYHALIALRISQDYWVILVGISGHMGTEALKAFGDFWKSRVK